MNDRNKYSKALAALLVILCATSCKGDFDNGPSSKAAPALFTNLVEKASNRTVVALVNGKPVYGQCVETQAKAHSIDRQSALDECIGFELLAQSAEALGYLADPKVQERGKEQLVRIMIEREYYLRSPKDIPEHLVNALWGQVRKRYNHEELKEIAFCRIPLKGVPADSPKHTIGKSYLDGIYEELRAQKDLVKEDLFVACYGPVDQDGIRYKKANVHELFLRTMPLRPRRFYAAPYQAPLFESGQKGRILPPLWTEEGWDLILITDSKDAIQTSFSEAEPKLRKALFEEPVYEEHRRALFAEWAESLTKSIPVTTHPEHLAAPVNSASPLQASAKP